MMSKYILLLSDNARISKIPTFHVIKKQNISLFKPPNNAWLKMALHLLLRPCTAARFAGNPKVFPSQPGDIVSPACPGSSIGGSSQWNTSPRSHPGHILEYKMPEPPHLPPLNMTKQRLDSCLMDDCVSHAIFTVEPGH